jgi:hypothetical protein
VADIRRSQDHHILLTPRGKDGAMRAAIRDAPTWRPRPARTGDVTRRNRAEEVPVEEESINRSRVPDHVEEDR